MVGRYSVPELKIRYMVWVRLGRVDMREWVDMNTQKNVKNWCKKYIVLPIFYFLSQPCQMINLWCIYPAKKSINLVHCLGLYMLCFIGRFFSSFWNFWKLQNFQTFKEKLQKKVTKMTHVIVPIQPDLPALQFMKSTFHENGYCSQSCGLWLFVSFWMCSLVFFSKKKN